MPCSKIKIEITGTKLHLHLVTYKNLNQDVTKKINNNKTVTSLPGKRVIHLHYRFIFSNGLVGNVVMQAMLLCLFVCWLKRKDPLFPVQATPTGFK